MLKENKVIREQCSELQKSLEFHINEMEELSAENKDLKREVKSLKETLNEANEVWNQLHIDLGTAINRTDIGGRRGIFRLKIFRIPLFSRVEYSHSLIIFRRIFLIILVIKC